MLSNVPVVTPSARNGLRLIIERTLQREDVELNLIADIDSLPTLVAIAASTGSAVHDLAGLRAGTNRPCGAAIMRKIVRA